LCYGYTGMYCCFYVACANIYVVKLATVNTIAAYKRIWGSSGLGWSKGQLYLWTQRRCIIIIGPQYSDSTMNIVICIIIVITTTVESESETA